ncbi:hypothetical protein XA39_09455 [Acinetobacter tandoii]|uniref:hypothetical protein n=1 Tax=Acinetobacter tandoii TaxID=202954 RepID=UPI000C20C5D4|nr:hypothetical protein [Acinetobacter tandoii]PJG43067.1 hypothetical protein XA39_09455 [Acinetobacter tandoii]
MSTSFSQLKLSVQAPLKLKDLTYKFVVINNATKKKTTFDGRFDEQGLTGWTEIYNSNTSLIYEVYLRGEVLQKIAVKAYPDQKKVSTFTIKMTTDRTKKVKENIKEIHLSDGEVAWYLIKNEESVLGWSQRVFKKPLVPSDWEILKANNPHLSNLVSVGLLQPGQVVILSNTTTAKELVEYKKQAQQAHKKLEEMKKDEKFDVAFFAQNYEFFYDALSNDKTEISNINIFKNNDHPLVNQFNNSSNDSGIAWGAIAKGGIDGALAFSDGIVMRMNKIHGELALKMTEEKAKGSALANPKNFKDFRKKYKDLYDQLDRESTKKIFKWDQSIKTNNMRRMINQSSLARGKTYKGGMTEYTKKMSELGKMSKTVKGGGYLFLALDVYNAYDAVENAAPTEKTKTAVVETSKIGGGLAGGAAGVFIVLTVATGGTSLVVLGLAAGASALLGWGVGEVTGWGAEKAYDIIEDKIN